MTIDEFTFAVECMMSYERVGKEEKTEYEAVSVLDVPIGTTTYTEEDIFH